MCPLLGHQGRSSAVPVRTKKETRWRGGRLATEPVRKWPGTCFDMALLEIGLD